MNSAQAACLIKIFLQHFKILQKLFYLTGNHRQSSYKRIAMSKCALHHYSRHGDEGCQEDGG